MVHEGHLAIGGELAQDAVVRPPVLVDGRLAVLQVAKEDVGDLVTLI